MSETKLYIRAALIVAASASGFAAAQGTQTTTQRSFQGWLTDTTDPIFWTWKPGAGVTAPVYSDHMQPWIHIDVNDVTGINRYYDTTTFALNQTRIDSLAQTIVARWHALGRPTNYAIFIHGWGWKTGLYAHPDDHLQAPSGGNWNRSDLPESGTPWREEGVNLSAAVLDALISSIATQADPGSPADPNFVLPPPSRILFDEEYGIGSFCGSPNVRQMYSAIGANTSQHSEVLFGDHSLRTAATSPTISDAFGSTIWAWATTLTWSDTTNYPCYPWYGLHFLNEFYSTHTTNLDGALRATFDLGTASHPTWQSTVVANYATSGWYDFDYPTIGYGGFGARGPATYASGAPRGWQQSSVLGSTHAQSQVLYSAFAAHRDLDDDLQSGGNPLEASYYDTWLRISRMKLDHALFTLDNGTTDAPSHIIPWLPRVGSPIGDISQTGVGSASEAYSRDVLAMAKSKGIREGIWWGNETSSAGNDLFEATAIVTDQVMNYSLVSVSTFKYDETTPLTKHTGTGLNPFLFAEEHAIDIEPALRNDMPAYTAWYNDPSATGYFTALEATFQLAPSDFGSGPVYYFPNSVSFVIEALDGGGHWDRGPWALSDFHELALVIPNTNPFGSPIYIPVSSISGASIKELYSTSTRKSQFSTDTSQTFDIGAYTYSFDDEGLGQAYTLSNVIDRKTILRIDIPLDFTIDTDEYVPTDFFTSTKQITLRYSLYHEADTKPKEEPLPYRLDLLQLYDSTPAEDTRLTESAESRGDLNSDGTVDAQDIMLLVRAIAAGNATPGHDLDGDGRVNVSDLQAILEMRADR